MKIVRLKALLALAAVASLSASSADAAVIFSDNFDTYADQTAMNAVWTPSAGTGAALSSAQSVSAPSSAFIPGNATAYRSTHVLGTEAPVPTDAAPVTWSFQYYDANAGVAIARNYNQLWDNSAGLAQLISLGVYNSVPGESVSNHHTYYGARVAFGGGPGWILLKAPGVATRSIGWHELKAVFKTSTVDFYVDGTLGAADVTYGGGYTFDTLQLGSGLSSAGGAAHYDDVSLTAVPEPATFVLAGCGLLGVVLASRRRLS